jgi:PAS domain S-box-containing protein
MWMVDMKTFRITSANAAAARLFGYREEELLTKTALDLVVPESVDPLRDAFSHRPFAGDGGEWTVRYSDGTPFRIHVRFHYVAQDGTRQQFTFADAIYGHPTFPDGRTKGISRAADTR